MKVSIVVICQNEEKYIARCLGSILDQSYENIEVIVVDSSSDSTPQIIGELQSKSRFPFRVIFQPEGTNIARKRNIGLDVAEGDLVTGLDADQVMPPRYIEDVVQAFDSEKVLGVCTKHIIAKPKSRSGKLFYFFDKTFYSSEPEVVPGKPETCTAASVYRTSFLRSIGGYNILIQLRDDTDLWERVRKRIIELNKEGGFYFKRLDKTYFLEYKRAYLGLWNHLKKMVWYGYLGVQDVRLRPRYSFSIILVPLYFLSIPILFVLLSFRVLPLGYAFLTVPFFALFPYSLVTATRRHVPHVYAFSFPLIMVFKSLGATYGIIKYVFLGLLRKSRLCGSVFHPKDLLNKKNPFSKNRLSIRRYYDDIATKRFKWIKTDKPSRVRHEYITEMCKNAWGLILDVGCGFGEILSSIKYENNETVGVDISRNALRIAKPNIAHAIVCDAENLPLRGNCVKLALCVEVLEHLLEPMLCVHEIHRILKDKGEAIFTTPNPSTRFIKDKEHIQLISEDILKDMIGKVGFQTLSFKIIRIKYSIFSQRYEETQVLWCQRG